MHAVPEYVQKEWDRKQRVDHGAQLKVAVETQHHNRELQEHINREKYNQAVKE